MQFNEWINRPVYKAQVHTFNIVKTLYGLSGDVVTTGNHPITYFRLVPQHRCAISLAIRKRVADIVKIQRKSGTYQLKEVTA